jgi:hypothetical protein
VLEAESVIDARFPGWTVIVLVAVNAPELPVVVAVIVLVQVFEVFAAVTSPVLLTVAHDVVEEVQLTCPLRFFVLPSS